MRVIDLIGVFVLMVGMGIRGYGFSYPTPEELEALPGKEVIPYGSLDDGKGFPRLLPEGALESAKKNATETEWGRKYLEGVLQKIEFFSGKSNEELAVLVPPPGSLVVMGLGMNLDPVDGTKMGWCGWSDPFRVVAENGEKYPNEAWKDEGKGSVREGTKERFYFVALANGFILRELETVILPALAEAYALSGEKRYAEQAAVLLDHLAALYPNSFRGPLDYPMDAPLRRYGGRLNRPTAQVARGLQVYIPVMDLIAASGVLGQPSRFRVGKEDGSIGDHLLENLIYDGGSYCLLFGRQANDLGNGTADFNIGSALAGVMLKEPAFMEILLQGPNNIYRMLENNIVRGEFYFETSPGYEEFCRQLYRVSADAVEAIRRQHGESIRSVYGEPGFVAFQFASYSKRQVGGHIPLLGNTRVDVETVEPGQAFPAEAGVTQNKYRVSQLEGAWRLYVHAPDARVREEAKLLLQHLYRGKEVVPPMDFWSVANISQEQLEELKKAPARELEVLQEKSAFYGGKGIALVRGGEGAHAHGFQFLFGPAQIKSQNEALTWTFFNEGAEWSFDSGRFNAHFRFGWSAASVAHQSLVVNRENTDMGFGGGVLESWMVQPNVQWVRASAEGVYPETKLEHYARFLGQVQDSPGGKLLYWVDMGYVSGGERREDAFHSQMQEITPPAGVEFRPSGEKSLYGKENFGEMVLGDYTLNGYDQGFYWRPPGAGFGFLGNPAIVDASGEGTFVFSNPAFFKHDKTELLATFPVLPGVKRQWIRADGPMAPAFPRVPHLLQSDTGPGASHFHKILRFREKEETDPIKYVKSFHVVQENGSEAVASSAVLVQREDGMRDVWMVQFKEPVMGKIAIEGLPVIHSDAKNLLVRFNAENQPVLLLTDGASRVEIDGYQPLSGDVEQIGHIESVHFLEGTTTLDIHWKRKREHEISRYSELLVVGGKTIPGSWQVMTEGAGEGKLVLHETHPWVAETEVSATEEGWWQMHSLPSRFQSGSAIANIRLAQGMPVYYQNKMIGRIQELSEDAGRIKITPSVKFPEKATIRISEFAPGDPVRISSQIHARAEDMKKAE